MGPNPFGARGGAINRALSDLGNTVPESGIERSGGENDLREAGGGFNGGVEVDAFAGVGDSM